MGTIRDAVVFGWNFRGGKRVCKKHLFDEMEGLGWPLPVEKVFSGPAGNRILLGAAPSARIVIDLTSA